MNAPVTEDEVRQFAREHLGIELVPWQAAWVTQMVNNGDQVFWNSGRKSGRATSMRVARMMLAETLAVGGETGGKN